ncbi:MAG: T9SS type A sorting domain-containing protein, partial [Flavobacterium sp.]|nr:T9SS type A sorting domain-containing protein [Flavobacterium sp.]
ANWVADERGQFTYNSNNKLTEELYEEWENSQWVNSSKSLYAYDTNHQMISSRNATWDDFNNLYKEFYRTDYVLDGAGNRISETDTDVNNNNKWKDEYTYDSLSLMSNFAHPFKDKNGLDYLTEDFPYVNKILAKNHYYYDMATSNYTLSSRTTYNYNSALTLAVENPEIVKAGITIFPNPTASVINLDFSEAVTIDKVVVVDITGKTVLQQGANTTQVNVEKLAKGLYIIEAYSGKEKFTSKFVKK